MQSASQLKDLLTRIDRKSYPAYKDTRGTYQFPGYVLSIDHVQGDPFAAPSQLSVHLSETQAGFPTELWGTTCCRVALQDELTRQFSRQAAQASFQAKGSGHSGLISVSRCGQQVLERTACSMDPHTGSLVMRLGASLPMAVPSTPESWRKSSSICSPGAWTAPLSTAIWTVAACGPSPTLLRIRSISASSYPN